VAAAAQLLGAKVTATAAGQGLGPEGSQWRPEGALFTLRWLARAGGGLVTVYHLQVPEFGVWRKPRCAAIVLLVPKSASCVGSVLLGSICESSLLLG
jgi:hypothetical protein